MSDLKPGMPLIHMNGTSADELKEHYQDAYQAISHAQERLALTHPNMRDFYPLKDGEKSFQAARDKHFARLAQLSDIKAELVEIVEAIDKQVELRRAVVRKSYGLTPEVK